MIDRVGHLISVGELVKLDAVTLQQIYTYMLFNDKDVELYI